MSGANRILLSLVAFIVLLIAGSLLVIWILSPTYDGDPSVYKYKVVQTSVWFDPERAVYLPGSPREAIRLEQRTFYANEYEMRDSGLLLLKKGWAEWERTAQGNYRLNVVSPDWIHRGISSTSQDDVTIFRQSDGKRVFNSTEHLRIYQRTYDGP
ncbi:MAG: hypothetical protein WAP51_03055 [Candidatus Sungiibacteriota bacterium]